MRSLIGRTATALHSVGSRHQMRALYIDTIVNEDAANLARYEQWRAWMVRMKSYIGSFWHFINCHILCLVVDAGISGFTVYIQNRRYGMERQLA